MDWGRVLRDVLTLSMVFVMIWSCLLLSVGIGLRLWLKNFVESYFDPTVKSLDLTKLVIHAQESIVPTKDDLPDEIDLGEWPNSTGTGIIFLSLAMLATALYGTVAARSRKPVLLLTITLLMSMAILMQFTLFASIVDISSGFHENAKDELENLLDTQYEVGAATNNTFTFLLNSVMLMGECCGIRGPVDFLYHNLTFVYSLDKKHFEVPVLFPPACCKHEYIAEGFFAVLNCTKSFTGEAINNRGCYNQVFVYIRDHYGHRINWFFISLVLWEAFQIMLTILLIFHTLTEKKTVIKHAGDGGDYMQDKIFDKLEMVTSKTSLPLPKKRFRNIFASHTPDDAAKPRSNADVTDIW